MKRSKYRYSKSEVNQDSIFLFTQSVLERKATRLLREMCVYVRTRRLKAKEAQGPPAESECLQYNETDKVQISPNLRVISIPSSYSRKVE
ncbi:hypothetical protein [Peribacillus muralis]|uniref:hypothetical protein n=1 Tax=Peribacillus muralis TaxID=264697 RepID=UPI0036729159